MLFQDRQDAGRQLAIRLASLHLHPESAIVLAIPRGGVVVGAEIAQALHLPMDVYIIRKLGAPGNPELAIGAVAADGTTYLDETISRSVGASEAYVALEAGRQAVEVQRRLRAYRGDRPPPTLKAKQVVLVDDGIATGATTIVALLALRQQEPASLILAVPVGPPDALQRMRGEADQVVVLAEPEPFWAVGAFFSDWSQTSDSQVIELIEKHRQRI
jgi:putative phosphoribosyl transferase